MEKLADAYHVLHGALATSRDKKVLAVMREHYAQTLRHWVANLEAHWDEAQALVGPHRARIWRLYMAACALNFEAGRTGRLTSLSLPHSQRASAADALPRRIWRICIGIIRSPAGSPPAGARDSRYMSARSPLKASCPPMPS